MLNTFRATDGLVYHANYITITLHSIRATDLDLLLAALATTLWSHIRTLPGQDSHAWTLVYCPVARAHVQFRHVTGLKEPGLVRKCCNLVWYIVCRKVHYVHHNFTLLSTRNVCKTSNLSLRVFMHACPEQDKLTQGKVLSNLITHSLVTKEPLTRTSTSLGT